MKNSLSEFCGELLVWRYSIASPSQENPSGTCTTFASDLFQFYDRRSEWLYPLDIDEAESKGTATEIKQRRECDEKNVLRQEQAFLLVSRFFCRFRAFQRKPQVFLFFVITTFFCDHLNASFQCPYHFSCFAEPIRFTHLASPRYLGYTSYTVARNTPRSTHSRSAPPVFCGLILLVTVLWWRETAAVARR